MSDTDQIRKDPKFIASAILIALIVIAAVVLIGMRLIGGDDGSSTDPSPAKTSGSTTNSSSACGLPDGDQTVPTTAPDGKWYFVGKVAAPKSDALGPARVEDGLATCFAHSPAGALFAAATIAGETYPSDDAAEKAARARIVPGDLLDQALAAPSESTDVPSQIAGFKFEDATRDRVTLTLVARISSGPNAGALGATPMTLVWREGDWWWELQPTASSVVVTSLDGFTEWSGVS